MLFKKMTCVFLVIVLLGPVINAQSRVDTTRLAIVLGGAVSLGAFEAGAIAELVRQLEYYNKENREHQYVIDILVGASAGSMTLAMLATQIFDTKISPYHSDYHQQNIFYKAWVDSIDIRFLLPEKRPNINNDPYLLSRDRVDLLGDLFLKDQLGSNNPLSIAPDTLKLAMTLSNLEGNIDSVKFVNNQKKEITLYDEQRFFQVMNRGRQVKMRVLNNYREVGWKDIRNAAIASGAFPLAFEPKKINDAYTNAMVTSQQNQDVLYVDGGFFRNNPLQIAKDLASQDNRNFRIYDRRQLDNLDRIFIFVTPVDIEENLTPSAQNSLQPDTHNSTNLFDIVTQIINMALTTARTLDYREYIKDEQKIQRDLMRLLSNIYQERDNKELILNVLRAIQMGFLTDNLDHLKTFINSYKDKLAKIDVVWSENYKNELIDRLDIFQLDQLAKLCIKSDPNFKLAIPYQQSLQVRNQIIERADLYSLVKDSLSAQNPLALREIFKNEVFIKKFLCKFEPTDTLNQMLKWLICDADPAFQQLYVDFFEIGKYHLPSRYVLLANDPSDYLAGRRYSYFGGFLNRSLRDYDYKLGRYYAQQALKSQLNIKGLYLDISDPEKEGWLHSLKTPPDQLNHLKDHLNQQEQNWVRRQLDQRLIAYAHHISIPPPKILWASPILGYLDHLLDRELYFTPKKTFFGWHINSDRPRSFDLGFHFNLINIFSHSYIQGRGGNWLAYFALHEHYIVLNSGFTDLAQKALISTYYQQFGLKLNLYWPHPLIRFLRIQPEMGQYFGTNRLKRDRNLSDFYGGYFAMTFRITSFDLKLQKFYQEKIFGNKAYWKINFGLTIPITDYWFFKRL
ncbi:patatin-like phospholipase family protein [candidate division KSB1 bacterium]|nr:patatin-like phospholipase family protein [candidate division KSB1 bacterium]